MKRVMHKMGLLRVTSIVNNLSHGGEIYDGVEMRWFVVYRDSPSVANNQVIMNHTKNLDNSHYVCENNLYELFTEKEANALKKYLLRVHKQECEIKETDLLLEVYTLGYGNRVLGNREGYYRLDNEDNYDLPFVVWGYYDVSYGRDDSWLTYEMRLMERALNKSGIPITDKGKLKALIENLKDEGMIVERDIRKKERIKEAKYLMGASIKSLMDSEGKYKRIAFSIMSVILILLFGLLVFNNRSKSTKIVSNAKPESVYSKSSKEVYGKVTPEEKVSAKETAQENTGKTPEIQTTETEGEKETIQQISFQKKYLIVISKGANIREGPGMRFPIRLAVKKGEVIERLDDKQQYWIKIKTQGGVVGWVSKSLLEEID